MLAEGRVAVDIDVLRGVTTTIARLFRRRAGVPLDEDLICFLILLTVVLGGPSGQTDEREPSAQDEYLVQIVAD